VAAKLKTVTGALSAAEAARLPAFLESSSTPVVVGLSLVKTSFLGTGEAFRFLLGFAFVADGLLGSLFQRLAVVFLLQLLSAPCRFPILVKRNVENLKPVAEPLVELHGVLEADFQVLQVTQLFRQLFFLLALRAARLACLLFGSQFY
jgi:hypothetical protein